MDIFLEEIRTAAEEVGREVRARFIALFGSVAREDERAPEDIDLAILSREKLDPVAITIDNEIVLAAVTQARTQFREYVASIEARLEEQGL